MIALCDPLFFSLCYAWYLCNYSFCQLSWVCGYGGWGGVGWYAFICATVHVLLWAIGFCRSFVRSILCMYACIYVCIMYVYNYVCMRACSLHVLGCITAVWQIIQCLIFNCLISIFLWHSNKDHRFNQELL